MWFLQRKYSMILFSCSKVSALRAAGAPCWPTPSRGEQFPMQSRSAHKKTTKPDHFLTTAYSCASIHGVLVTALPCRRCDVLVRGFSGYNSRQWRTVCRQLPCPSLQGDVATLWLGANDAAGNSPQQGVPLTEYGDNLVDIVCFLKVIEG